MTTSAPLPSNIEAEQGVLGAVLIDNSVIGPISLSLRPDDFSEDVHRRIWHFARELHQHGRPVTPATLRTYLGEHDLGGLTVPQYLVRLAAEALPPKLAPGMARRFVISLHGGS